VFVKKKCIYDLQVSDYSKKISAMKSMDREMVLFNIKKYDIYQLLPLCRIIMRLICIIYLSRSIIHLFILLMNLK